MGKLHFVSGLADSPKTGIPRILRRTLQTCTAPVTEFGSADGIRFYKRGSSRMVSISSPRGTLHCHFEELCAADPAQYEKEGDILCSYAQALDLSLTALLAKIRDTTPDGF